MDEVSFLEELISIPSLSGQEDEIAGHLVERMSRLGFRRAYRDGAGNAVGVVGSVNAKREIVLLGHMDTVPGDIRVRRRSDLLYGRGSVDAKGSLATFVLATARVASKLRDTCVVVIAAVEEEANGRGAHYLAGTMEPPDCAIIGEPSDWEGITLGYKGRMCVDYRRVQPGSHGAGGRKSTAEQAIGLWNRLTDYTKERNGGRSGRFDTLDPALREFHTSSDGLEDSVEMSIAVRLPLGFEPSVLKRKIQRWGDSAELAFSPIDMPFQAQKNTRLVRAFLQAIRAEGGRPCFKLKTGTSDMNVVGPVWECPIVAYGPGDSTLDHTPHEHIDVGEFRQAIDVLSRVLTMLAGEAG